MNKISAVLVIYNEENVIKRCLDSIKDLVDEIIIVHDGKCTDKSIEICEKYTDKIYIQKHKGVAEIHRIFSFNRASSKWILQIDADEYINKSDHKKIKALIENDNITAYSFLWRLWNGEKYITKYSPHKTCLVKKDAIKFIASPHEVINVKFGTISNSNICLEHKPNYNNYSFKIFKSKLKWAKIQARMLSLNFKDIEKIGYKKGQKKWPFPKEIRKKHPILFIPIDGLVPIAFIPYKFKTELNFNILKLIIFQSIYNITLCIYIYKYTHKHNMAILNLNI